MKLKLSEFFIYLVQKKGFYGLLASSLERVARPGLGTLAVGVQHGRVVLYYDPSFIEEIPFKSALFALEHEMLHLVLDHIPRYFELLAQCPTEERRAKAAAVYNIAMDCAINSLLRQHEGFDEIEQFIKDRIKTRNPDVPVNPLSGMCLPEKWQMPRDASFEFYQWTLMARNQQEDLTKVEGGSDHSMWVNGTESAESSPKDGSNASQNTFLDGSAAQTLSADDLTSHAVRIREQLKEALRTADKAAGSAGRDVLPGDVLEWLDTYLAAPVIPWWEVFAAQAQMSRVSKQRRTVAVPNRMLLALAEEDVQIMPIPGRIRDKAWRVFLYVDTSGSMSSESLSIVKSELQHMLAVDENMEIRYMQGDSVTHMDILLHSGDTIPTEVSGRGGTDFDAYFIHMNQYVHEEDTSPDIVIVYTDGYAPAVQREHQLPSHVPVLWLVTPSYGEHFNRGYGEIIVCDPEQNDRYKN